MKALLIGGDGFIGRNLTTRLISKGYECIVIDNHVTSRPTNRTDCIVYDKDWLSFDDNILLTNFDEIYYLASYPSPKSYKKHQNSTLKLGYEGVRKVLDLAIKIDDLSTNSPKLFLASSSEVYGNSTEDMEEKFNYGHVNTYGERSCYDESKRVMETLAYIYENIVDCRIGRIFNTYGPGMAMDGRVFTNFIQQAVRNEPLEIYESADVTRTPTYIDDLLTQIDILMSANRKDIDGPVNIGGDVEYRLCDIAEFTLEVTKSDSPVIIVDGKTDKDDPQVRKPILTKINSLGYKGATVDLREGITKLYNDLMDRKLI